MRTTKYLVAVAVTGIFLAMAGPSSAVSIIDTTGSWNGTDEIDYFGETDTATYGQTFTATGPETVLDSFTFYVDDYFGLFPDFTDFEAYVYEWDGSKATGSALYTSSPMTTSNNGGAGGFETFTINTGGVSLTAGSQYVAFFNTSNLFDGNENEASFGSIASFDAYSGGEFVFLNNGSNFGAVTTSAWTDDWQGTDFDLAFTMEFSTPGQPIPEPATMTLLGLGLAGLAARSRRTRKS